MRYRKYIPLNPSTSSVVVMVGGGGHRMKVWEVTPDGRKGWAPLLAQAGREVITVEWACNSQEIYKCSQKELCSLTQKENMDLIRRVIDREVPKGRKVVFLGWSMGGPQVFKLACDIIPKRTAAILGYAATGPLNCFKPSNKQDPVGWDYHRPIEISRDWIEKQSQVNSFPKKHHQQYIQEYLVPFSPLMAAIQSKRPETKKYWPLLTVKHPHNLPPVLLANGSSDLGHTPSKEQDLLSWLKTYQSDVTLKHVKGFSHLGMICHNNQKITDLYLKWLKKRKL